MHDLAFEHLKVSLDAGVLTLMIDRPAAKNALYGKLYAHLAHALEFAERSPEVKNVILRGAGADFTAGNDLDEFIAFSQMSDIKDAALPAFRFIKAAATLSKPLIIAIKGVAIGIGTTILCHADFVYCDDTAVFALPFVSLGLTPEAGMTRLMTQQIGYLRTCELLFCAKKFDAALAKDYGLISHITHDTDVYEHAQNTARALAALPMSALTASKRLLRQDLDETLACIDKEGEVFLERLRSKELLEAISAFREKRPADFSQFDG
ncbi:enoyl-CoA hydratase [Moraxella caviae]|uniref:Enoyl-CoA hydratase n=1 Tax=Moraxella caviae TaxID=34060 RepID=A0A1T0A2I8_9GAMM|nr:enoyl-CoA hydratase [Moraxella caviae]